PSNLAISIMEERNVEVISGMNIPMLVKLMRERSETIPDAVAAAQEAGRKYINIASHLLKLDT
ncbi:MAG: PTS fructose transporter subunit IIA, partial [Alphaproteobacteria bacterium]|nr:PTS fructose transporter subunit IIA [Alphaproteobacteria bacterium]